MAPLVWLVTGTTSGIGAALVDSIAARGDMVIATGRNASQRLAYKKSDNVAVLDLDVTAPKADIETQIRKGLDIFGRIDVLINNAGMSSTSSIEEASEDFVSQLFQVNLFGAMKVTQAVLPHMRAQKFGRIGFIGAGLGWQPFPFLGHYAMSKAALSMFAEALEKEVSICGVRAVVFELGGFHTGLGARRDGDAGSFGEVPKVPEYQAAFGAMMQAFATEVGPDVPGDTEKLPKAVIDVIKGEGLAEGRKWPVRVAMGPDSVAVVRQKCQEQLNLSEEWDDVAGTVVRDDWSGNISQYMLDSCSMVRTPGK